jgi:hypothetical protein
VATAVKNYALTGQQPFLTKELARPVRDDHLLLGLAVLIDDVDRAFENHDQVVALVAVGEQPVAAFHLGLVAVPAEGRELGFPE